MRALLYLAIALLLGTTLSAQQASYTYINQPPPYSNPSTPYLVALNTPKVGTTFQVQIPTNFVWGFVGRPYGANYFLLTGVTNPAVDLGVIGITGVLFSSGEVVIPSMFGGLPGSMHTVSTAVPTNSSLMGVGFYQQVVEVQSFSYYPVFVMVSRGGHGVIGY